MQEENKVNKDILHAWTPLSSKVLNEDLNDKLDQNFNYYIQRGHLGYLQNDDYVKMVKQAKKAGFSMLGFSEYVPNSSLELPEEDNRMLLSEVDEYISLINDLKQKNSEVTILAGFEAEYDFKKEAFLRDMKNKVDYMILNQHFLFRGSTHILPDNNPNYPIEYANMVVKAIDSGIFDIVAHPDIFIKYRDTMKNDEAKKLFDENCVLASQVICEKVRDMGILLEINYDEIKKNLALNDGREYSNLIFWRIAKDTEGLKILWNGDGQSLKDLKNEQESFRLFETVKDKIVRNYNPVIVRQNNLKLQEAYKKSQNNALTYETQMINQLLEDIMSNFFNELSSWDVALNIKNGLDGIMQRWFDNATKKSNDIALEVAKLTEKTEALTINERKVKIARKRKLINEINQVLLYQQEFIEKAKNNVLRAMNIGCEKREEYSNVITLLTEYDTTNSLECKQQIEKYISNFQQIKTKEKALQPQLKQIIHLKESSNGFVNIVLLSFFVIFIIGVAIGIGCVLYKIGG